MQVSVYAARALPHGVDIKVAVDAVTDAQHAVFAHNGPLPLPLQRLLAPSAQHARKGGSTAFSAPGDRRKAHIHVPEVRRRLPLPHTPSTARIRTRLKQRGPGVYLPC